MKLAYLSMIRVTTPLLRGPKPFPHVPTPRERLEAYRHMFNIEPPTPFGNNTFNYPCLETKRWSQ